MKAKLFFLTALLFLVGCSLIRSPNATVKAFLAAAQKGDVDTMTKLFSSKAIQKIGLDKVRSNNQTFAETAQRAVASGGSYRRIDGV
jgi:limonene-1,2-epoxide hydrolase